MAGILNDPKYKVFATEVAEAKNSTPLSWRLRDDGQLNIVVKDGRKFVTVVPFVVKEIKNGPVVPAAVATIAKKSDGGPAAPAVDGDIAKVPAEGKSVGATGPVAHAVKSKSGSKSRK